MATESGSRSAEEIGSWQEILRPVRSERVEKARERVRKEAEICLERIRAELKAYDPPLAKLCAEILGDGPWRYTKPQQRKPADRAHLAGYDFTQSPTFQWRKN